MVALVPVRKGGRLYHLFPFSKETPVMRITKVRRTHFLAFLVLVAGIMNVAPVLWC